MRSDSTSCSMCTPCKPSSHHCASSNMIPGHPGNSKAAFMKLLNKNSFHGYLINRSLFSYRCNTGNNRHEIGKIRDITHYSRTHYSSGCYISVLVDGLNFLGAKLFCSLTSCDMLYSALLLGSQAPHLTNHEVAVHLRYSRCPV